MGYDEGGTPKETTRKGNPSVRITPARSRATQGLEIRRNGEWLEVTFAAPDIAESQFRYTVGRRYLLVWSDKGHPSHHHFVSLPTLVNPREHILSFLNGVVDARIRLGA